MTHAARKAGAAQQRPHGACRRRTAWCCCRIRARPTSAPSVSGRIRSGCQENRSQRRPPGAPRRGPALLGGLLVCGRCGYRLMVNYTDNGRSLHYCCSRGFDVLRRDGMSDVCPANGWMRLVAEQVLAVLQPAALELHLAAAEDVEAADGKLLHQNWQQQLQRATYEVGAGQPGSTSWRWTRRTAWSRPNWRRAGKRPGVSKPLCSRNTSSSGQASRPG